MSNDTKSTEALFEEQKAAARAQMERGADDGATVVDMAGRDADVMDTLIAAERALAEEMEGVDQSFTHAPHLTFTVETADAADFDPEWVAITGELMRAERGTVRVGADGHHEEWDGKKWVPLMADGDGYYTPTGVAAEAAEAADAGGDVVEVRLGGPTPPQAPPEAVAYREQWHPPSDWASGPIPLREPFTGIKADLSRDPAVAADPAAIVRCGLGMAERIRINEESSRTLTPEERECVEQARADFEWAYRNDYVLPHERVVGETVKALLALVDRAFPRGEVGDDG